MVKHHDGAFHWWQQLIDAGKLIAPFHVTHVDAHADLGYAGWYSAEQEFVGKKLLHRPVTERPDFILNNSGLNAGNYLLLAVACQWITDITYILHEDGSSNDIPNWIFRDKSAAIYIELPVIHPDAKPFLGNGLPALQREPKVRLRPNFADDYVAQHEYEFVVLSESPQFTPISSDALIDVVREYILET